MTVYVGQPRWPCGYMLMCHMIADYPDELREMAMRLGIDFKYLQSAHTHREHFDICKNKREAAIRRGAVDVDDREIVRMCNRRLRGLPLTRRMTG